MGWFGCHTAVIGFALGATPSLGAQAPSPVNPTETHTWQGPRLRVGVLDFSGSALQMQVATAPAGGSTTTIQLPAPADFARGLTQLVTTALTKEEQFIVLERAQLEKVTAERELGASGRVAPETGAALSKILGAQALVSGDITEFSYSQSIVGSKFKIIKEVNKQIGAKVDRLTAQVAIDIRIIDAATGEVMHSVRGEGKASSTGVARPHDGREGVRGRWDGADAAGQGLPSGHRASGSGDRRRNPEGAPGQAGLWTCAGPKSISTPAPSSASRREWGLTCSLPIRDWLTLKTGAALGARTARVPAAASCAPTPS